MRHHAAAFLHQSTVPLPRGVINKSDAATQQLLHRPLAPDATEDEGEDLLDKAFQDLMEDE